MDKKCSRCGQIKSVSEFSKRPANTDGYEGICKLCRRKQNQEWYQNNKERHRENGRRYSKTEKRQEYLKQYKEENRESILKYHRQNYEENKDDILEKNKKYYKNNRKKVLDRCKLYRDTHRTERNESLKNWGKRNPDKRRAQKERHKQNKGEEYLLLDREYSRKRRAIKANSDGSFTIEQWLELLEICDNHCLRCGSIDNLEADHIKPLSQGGSDWITNIQPLCKSCNCEKYIHTKDYRSIKIKQWAEAQRKRRAREARGEKMIKNIRLTHIDGKLPNLALMKLAHWHKSKGDDVYFTRTIERGLFEPEYDIVYGSAIFTFSQKRLSRFLASYPNATIGGTGSGKLNNVEEITGEYEYYDYSIYPEYKWSIGFTQRGCRLNCKFCVVPKKEGRPRPVNTIADIYRSGTPKNVCLLDNDFFGQPKEQWLARINEIKDDGFKVAFNQGINIRLITDEAAHWLAQIPYYDDQFKTRRLYTAWDNLKDERIFFDGVDRLEKAGIPPTHLMVYMLIGFDSAETFERIFYRFDRMVERGILPYPMVYNNKDKELKRFQRWVIRRYYKIIPWKEYLNNGRNQSYKKNNLQLQLI